MTIRQASSGKKPDPSVDLSEKWDELSKDLLVSGVTCALCHPWRGAVLER